MSDTTQRTDQSTDAATKTEASGQPTDVTAVDFDVQRVQYGERVEEEGLRVRPDPYAQYGNLDTTGESLASHGLNAISPVFAEGRVAALETAARALNPDDPTPQELVILPESTVTVAGSSRTPEDAKADIVGQLNRLAEEPVVVGASDRAAAEGTRPEDADESHEPSDEQIARERGQEPGRSAGTAAAPRTEPTTSAQEQATGQPPASGPPATQPTSTPAGSSTATSAAKSSGAKPSSTSGKSSTEKK